MRPKKQKPPFSWLRFFLSISLCILLFFGIVFGASRLIEKPNQSAMSPFLEPLDPATLAGLNQQLETRWTENAVNIAPTADSHTLARRLSLSLSGAVPSLEELRRLEATPDSDRLNAWLDHLLTDNRTSQYLAERFARVYVGLESNFIVYRRRRMVNWLAEQLSVNRPYDEIARELIASRGIWTTSPAANFITVTHDQENGPNEIKLAARTSRAFLGVSLDCMECHDDKFGDRWKQKDFHQLAAYFAQTEIGLSGVWDNPWKDYETRFRGKQKPEPVVRQVPYQHELVDTKLTSPREQLAQWITHKENRSFSRAVCNRVWALLFGRPLVTPIDDIPIDGEVDPVLEYLAEQFVAYNHDLRKLIKLIVNSQAFLRASKSDNPDKPISIDQENAWAAYPLTQLRPEQVSGSIIQAASIQSLDSSSHIVRRLIRNAETRDFVKRYGDKGENEFVEGTGTIPQRLILMNGKLVNERTQPNPLLNSTSRIAALTKTPNKAIENAFLTVLTRLPTETELNHFTKLIEGKKRESRQRAMQDVYWSLINTTEFSWNR